MRVAIRTGDKKNVFGTRVRRKPRFSPAGTRMQQRAAYRVAPPFTRTGRMWCTKPFFGDQNSCSPDPLLICSLRLLQRNRSGEQKGGAVPENPGGYPPTPHPRDEGGGGYPPSHNLPSWPIRHLPGPPQPLEPATFRSMRTQFRNERTSAPAARREGGCPDTPPHPWEGGSLRFENKWEGGGRGPPLPKIVDL